MKRVLIVSITFDELHLLKRVHQKSRPYDIGFECTASFGQDANWWLVNGPDVFILSLPEDPHLIRFYFDRLINVVPKDIPIIFLCESISPGIMQVAPLFKTSRVIKLPVNETFLYRAVLDLSADTISGKKQTEPRFITDLEIVVEVPKKQDASICRMKNISQGGLYFETRYANPNFQPGTDLRIQIELPNKKIYELNAKIAWMKKLATEDVHGFGCSFKEEHSITSEIIRELN